MGGPADLDIMGALISEDNKVVDGAGFTISNAPDFQEMPVIATDGEQFLVVWQDFRNGKDYDIYAARVAKDGKVLDSTGIPVSIAPNNQCYPSVSYDGSNFVVVWMDNRDILQSYHVRAARITSAGMTIDSGGVVISQHDKGLLDKLASSDSLVGMPTNSSPQIACNTGECLVGWIQKTAAWTEYPRFVYLKTTTKPEIIDKPFGVPLTNATMKDYGDRSRNPAITVASDGASYFSVYSGVQGKGGGDYFITGHIFHGSGKEVKSIPIRVLKQGYRLSEAVMPANGQFVIIWSEGDRGDPRKPIVYSLKGAYVSKAGESEIFDISPKQSAYAGSLSLGFGGGRGLLVYEEVDKSGRMRIMSRGMASPR